MKKVIRTIAAVFAVAAVGFYFYVAATTETDPILGDMERWVGGHMALPIIAVTFVIIAFAFTGDSALSALTGRNSAAFRDGLVGVGTILSVTPTGMQLNDQPEVRLELEVNGAHGELFRSTAKLVVPVTQLAQIQPGTPIPVRYLPGRTDKVEVDRSGDPNAGRAAMEQALIRSGNATPESIDISRRGVPAQGVIRSLAVPGEIRDGKPKLVLDIVITRPDGSSFSIRKEPFVPPAAVPKLQIGCLVQVHYLPHDEMGAVISVPVA